MNKIKTIVEGAELVVERIGKDQFKIEIKGIKTKGEDSYYLSVGDTVTVMLPPLITDIDFIQA